MNISFCLNAEFRINVLFGLKINGKLDIWILLIVKRAIMIITDSLCFSCGRTSNILPSPERERRHVGR